MLCHRVASLLIRPGEARDRLTAGIYMSDDPQDITGCLEDALSRVIAAEPLERRLRHEQLEAEGLEDPAAWVARLRAAGQIDADEAELLLQAQAATRRVIMVDDFDTAELTSGGQPAKNSGSRKSTGSGRTAGSNKSASSAGTGSKKKAARARRPAHNKKHAAGETDTTTGDAGS